jgi:peptidyl-prolyl cis-trans isomerase C
MEHERLSMQLRIWMAPLLALICFAPPVQGAETSVAVVNGSSITERELESAVDSLIPRATFHGRVSDETRAEYREKALSDLIDFELEYQDAVARGVKPDQKAVDQEMERIRDSFPSSREYKEWLSQTSLTERLVRSKIERKLLVQSVIKAVVIDPSRVTDEAARTYYEQNTAKFRQPESARVRVISTKNEEKAKNVLDLLKKGEDFGNVAARMSEDNYRIKGGDIGEIHRGRIYPKLEEAVFSLKPGESSDLIWTEGMWFIVKVEARRPERQLILDEISEKLKQDLEKRNRTERFEEWLESLKSRAKIEIKLSSSQSSERQN